MTGMLARLASRFFAEISGGAKRIAHVAGLAALALVLAMVALGFATAGVFMLLRASYGATASMFIVAGGYAAVSFVVAAYIALAHHEAPPPGATVREVKQTLVDELRRSAGSDRERMALLAGAQIARDLRPMHLLLLSVVAGFVAGGWLDRRNSPPN
jgi:hypothetical protein